MNVGDKPIDVYDAVRNTFVARNVTGSTKVPLDADSAMVLVLAPAGGKETTQGRKTMIDGVAIDYDNGLVPRPQPKNRPPEADLSKTIAANRAPRGPSPSTATPTIGPTSKRNYPPRHRRSRETSGRRSLGLG